MITEFYQLAHSSHHVPKVALELSYLAITDTGCYERKSFPFFCIVCEILVRSATSTFLLRKTDCNQFYHPEVLSAQTDPLFYFFIYFSYLRILKCCYLGWKKKKKNSFSKQLYKTGCYREVRADNPLACSEGIIQTHAGKKASEIGRFQTGTWDQHDSITFFWSRGVDLLICGFWLGLISCQTTYIPAACLISLNQIAPLIRRNRLRKSYLKILQLAELSIHVSFDRHISLIITAGPVTQTASFEGNPLLSGLAKYLIENQMFLSHKH